MIAASSTTASSANCAPGSIRCPARRRLPLPLPPPPPPLASAPVADPRRSRRPEPAPAAQRPFRPRSRRRAFPNPLLPPPAPGSPNVRRRLEQIRDDAARSGMLAKAGGGALTGAPPAARRPSPAVAYSPDAKAPLADRLAAFSAWAKALLGSDLALVCDSHGDALASAGRGGDAAASAAAALVGEAWRRAAPAFGASGGNEIPPAFAELAPCRWLTALPAETPIGALTFAAVSPARPLPGEVEALRDGLRAAVGSR
ncbi:MAG: hypothetical protein R3F11_15455 [Verrucomicrobiales bacterium]